MGQTNSPSNINNNHHINQLKLSEFKRVYHNKGKTESNSYYINISFISYIYSSKQGFF